MPADPLVETRSSAGIGPELVYARGVAHAGTGGFQYLQTEEKKVAVFRWMGLTRSMVRVDQLIAPSSVSIRYGDLDANKWRSRDEPFVNEDGSLLVRLE